MVFSARQAVTCFLLIISSAVYAHSQTSLPTKTSTASISGKVTIKGKAAAGIVVGVRLVSRPIINPAVTKQSPTIKVTTGSSTYRQDNIRSSQLRPFTFPRIRDAVRRF